MFSNVEARMVTNDIIGNQMFHPYTGHPNSFLFKEIRRPVLVCPSGICVTSAVTVVVIKRTLARSILAPQCVSMRQALTDLRFRTHAVLLQRSLIKCDEFVRFFHYHYIYTHKTDEELSLCRSGPKQNSSLEKAVRVVRCWTHDGKTRRCNEFCTNTLTHTHETIGTRTQLRHLEKDCRYENPVTNYGVNGKFRSRQN